MPRFATGREAKEFLISRIATEAEKHGTPLSEVERKKMYFSETGWTLPDISEVSATFDQKCNQAEYEAKIAGLIRQVWATDRKGNQVGLETLKEAAKFVARTTICSS